MLLCSYFCITVLIPNAYNGTNVDGAVYNDVNALHFIAFLCKEHDSISSSHDWP